MRRNVKSIILLMILLIIISTGCNMNPTSKEIKNNVAVVRQIEKDISHNGFGEYSYSYFNEQNENVEVWIEIFKDGKQLTFDKKNKLFLQKRINSNSAKLGMLVRPDLTQCARSLLPQLRQRSRWEMNGIFSNIPSGLFEKTVLAFSNI